MGSSIGLKIRELRKQKFMTLKQLAGDRVTVAQISSIENGKSNPSKELLEYIAQKLEVDVEYFIFDEKERMQKKFDNVINQYKNNVLCENNISEVLDQIDEYKNSYEDLLDYQKGFYHYCYAKKYYIQNEYNRSFEEFLKAIFYYLKTEEYDIISDIYINLGNCSYFNEKYQLAFGYYKNSEVLIEKNILIDNIARTYYDLALCSIALNRYTLSDSYLKKLKDLIKNNDWGKRQNYLAGINMMQGNIDLKLKDANDSYNRFVKAYNVYKNSNDLEGMIKAKNNMAVCLWEQGKKDEAISLFKEITNIDCSVDIEIKIDGYLNLIDCLKETKKYEEAIYYINKCEEFVLNNNSITGIVKILKLKFDYYLEIKDYQRAEDYAFYAIDFIDKNSNEVDKKDIYIKLSQMHSNLGNTKQAIEYLLLSQNLKI